MSLTSPQSVILRVSLQAPIKMQGVLLMGGQLTHYQIAAEQEGILMMTVYLMFEAPCHSHLKGMFTLTECFF